MFNPNIASDFQNLRPLVWFEIMRARRRQLHMKELCKVFDVRGKKGDRFTTPTMGRLAVQLQAPGTPLNPQSININTFNVVVDLCAVIAVSWAKNADQFSVFTIKELLGDEMNYSLSEYVDNWVLGLRAAVSPSYQIVRSSTGTVAGDPQPLDKPTVETMLQRMVENKVRIDQLKWVFSPQQVMDLQQVIQFTSSDYNMAKLMLKEGIVGQLLGVPVLCTPAITNNKNDGWRNGSEGVPSPTPGVAGSEFQPTQDAIVGALPRGKTGAEAAQPFMTGMLVHNEWALFLAGIPPAPEMDYNMRERNTVMAYETVFGTARWRTDAAILVHTKGSTNPNA